MLIPQYNCLKLPAEYASFQGSGEDCRVPFYNIKSFR